ncbi:MAG: putative calcium-binding protein [Thermoleophilia bacterium]|nr:putative calcium-binding protein [Thermoleophilia bacterium]
MPAGLIRDRGPHVFARFRSQLRLLTIASVAVAAFALPASAHAAATLTIEPAYGSVEADSENEFSEGNETVSYELEVSNAGPDASASTKFAVSFQPAQLTIVAADITTFNDPLTGCVTTGSTTTTITCDLDAIAVDESVLVSVEADLAASFGGGSTSISFTSSATGTTDTLNDTTPLSYNVTCTTDDYSPSKSRTAFQSAPTFVVNLDCTTPRGDLTFATETGATGSVSQTDALEATYTPTQATLDNPKGFNDYFALRVTNASGNYKTVYIQPRATRSSDVKVAVTGVSTIAVPAGGVNVTYSMQMTNNGPEAIGDLGAGWTISDKATLVSATFDGAAATCENAMFGNEGERSYGCGSGALPAVGASKVATITIRYAAGEKALVVPSTVKVTGSSFPGDGAQDDAPADDNRQTISTALTTAAPATSGPLNLVGGNKKATYIGSGFADIFTGGSGNETFYAGGGSDRANGGKGNDKLFGQLGNDRLTGGTGNDTLNGGAGSDVSRGGLGRDRILCGSGTDKAFGDEGNDTIICRDGKGGDKIYGGSGIDTCIGDKKDVFVGCERIRRS